ncbi:hypothetical protein HanPSC8_Chr12g0521301 [Helianthus annuus]|nr:hypothetical protein HanPSC8_Chr12g0521301 [Helianthus annuus]
MVSCCAVLVSVQFWFSQTSVKAGQEWSNLVNFSQQTGLGQLVNRFGSCGLVRWFGSVDSVKPELTRSITVKQVNAQSTRRTR